MSIATRLAARLINGAGGAPSEDALRDAVAGKVVLVTGASYGIGEATARKLAGAGATVLIVARSEDRLEQLAAEIAREGGRAEPFAANLSDPEAVEHLAAKILERHEHVDVLVNNAGKSIRRSIDLSYDRFHDFERTIGINYLGPVKLVLELLPSMRARGEGHIVNVSTVGVRLPPAPRWAAYQASKAAFDVFLRSVASEARADGVDSTSVYMPLVHTRMSAPTTVLRAMPGLSPDQAADLICRAVVDRPRAIAPWWVPGLELAADVGRRPLDAALSAYHRLSEDSSSAAMAIGALRAAGRSGVLSPVRPDRLVRMVGALRLGVGPATAAAASAARYPDHPALIDERGTLTFAELDRRAGAAAAALRDDFEVGPGRALAIMCRNHRGFVDALLAGSRLGADLLLLNTDFPGPQLGQVLERQQVGAAVLDEEFVERFDAAGYEGARVIAWTDGGRGEPTLEELIAREGKAPGPPGKQGKLIVLTSGTTGAPKGAPRSPSLGAVVGPGVTLLSTLPLRAREPLLVAPPFFHGFGLAYLGLGLALPCTIVTRRRFDPEATLADIEENGVTCLAAVPVMLQRIMELPEEIRDDYDTSSLNAVVSAAAPLSGDLANAFMDAFGDVVYNLYGSTETGFGGIARPKDLRAAPGTVGRPPLGAILKILAEDGTEAPRGETGRIFLGGPLVFEGYSGGGSKETIDGLMSTGDLGHLDEKGRLFIDGREDDMIVSGGENVFPQEVEDVLARHEDVADVAVLGVDDEEFGQRLKAFVVPRSGAEPSEDDLKAYIKSNLARYKVPREIAFLDELPRNPTGKLLRSKLKETSG